MIVAKLWARIQIQERSNSVDSLGQPIESWNTIATTFADLRHMKGLESLRADAVTSVVKASFRIRYRPGITAGMRIVWNNLTYNIVAVLPQGIRNQFLDMTAERVTDVPPGD